MNLLVERKIRWIDRWFESGFCHEVALLNLPRWTFRRFLQRSSDEPTFGRLVQSTAKRSRIWRKILFLNRKLRYWNSLYKIRGSTNIMPIFIKISDIITTFMSSTAAVSWIFHLFIIDYQHNSKLCKFQIDGSVSHRESAGATPACL